ncbi:MAG: D-alanyl-D-alanine carboxypeptidase/D-alanyl-D-alanine-endopeptidase [Actinobacteria bacterium]|nr:D-alanyl-D-alanine carboxypeptidase/D-alanyl-D-alanine-endopeptidase [Actinomycetota bacterium]
MAVGFIRYKVSMRRRSILSLAIALALAGSLAASTSAPTQAASTELGLALGRALVTPGVAASRTAALAVDLETGAVVFSRNAGFALVPASAEKLAVSFAALRLLGPGYRFRTEVAGRGELTDHVWRGDLFLVGYGDPTLTPADLDALARDVAAWGIRRVTGRVLGDERHFDSLRGAPSWLPWFVGQESAPISALSVDDIVTSGADSSASAAARAFTLALARRGISVTRSSGAGNAPADVLPLALDLSDPLAEIVRTMNRESDNFIAEMLLKELGAGIARRGSTPTGAEVVLTELREAGVPTNGVRIADGSGLSRADRLTTEALVAILRKGSADPAIRDAFVTSLAVAGISGTLKRRLDRRSTRGRVIAKTGTTRVSSALAGFVRRRYVFAIIQNGSPVPYWTARQAQDRFVTVLARS